MRKKKSILSHCGKLKNSVLRPLQRQLSDSSMRIKLHAKQALLSRQVSLHGSSTPFSVGYRRSTRRKSPDRRQVVSHPETKDSRARGQI